MCENSTEATSKEKSVGIFCSSVIFQKSKPDEHICLMCFTRQYFNKGVISYETPFQTVLVSGSIGHSDSWHAYSGTLNALRGKVYRIAASQIS